MRKLLVLLLALSSFAYGQKEPEYTDVPFAIYGVWKNLDNEFVKIYSNIEGQTLFQRVAGRRLIAAGEIKRVNNELHIIRSDKADTYNLVFITKENVMVIMKPRSDQAWLWERVGQ